MSCNSPSTQVCVNQGHPASERLESYQPGTENLRHLSYVKIGVEIIYRNPKLRLIEGDGKLLISGQIYWSRASQRPIQVERRWDFIGFRQYDATVSIQIEDVGKVGKEMLASEADADVRCAGLWVAESSRET